MDPPKQDAIAHARRLRKESEELPLPIGHNPELPIREERLAALERTADYTATQLERLLEGQATLLRQLPAPQPRATTDAATPTRSAS